MRVEGRVAVRGQTSGRRGMAIRKPEIYDRKIETMSAQKKKATECDMGDKEGEDQVARQGITLAP